MLLPLAVVVMVKPALLGLARRVVSVIRIIRRDPSFFRTG